MARAAARSHGGGGDWAAKYRRTRDGSLHFGDLELITWDAIDGDGEELGWGGILANESEDLKKKFVRYGGNLADPPSTPRAMKKLLKYWGNAFRWTCCGVSVAEGLHGCDHHGHPDARKPCGCDFCRGGEALPESIWRKKLSSQAAKGLKLHRGPDPRSLSEMGKINLVMRRTMGRTK